MHVVAPTWSWMLEVAYGGLAVSAAVLLLALGTSRPVNRWFAAMLFVEGVGWGGIASGLLDPLGAGRWADALFDVFALSTVALPALSLAFTVWAIDAPLTVRLRHKGVGAGLLVVAVLCCAGYWFTGRSSDAAYGRWVDGAGWSLVAVSLVSLALAWQSYRATPSGTLGHRRAGAYLVAFAAHDLGMILTNVTLIYAFAHLDPEGATYAALRHWVITACMLYFFVFLAAVAYGTLRAQVLELDCKCRLTVSRGTVAAVFVAVFLIVAQVAQNWLSTTLGWATGGVAAGMLVLAVNPVQKFADTVARRAVPRTDAVVELGQAQRLDLYREQVALAWQDGSVGTKERAILRNLRERLGLSLEDAGRIELEVTGG